MATSAPRSDGSGSPGSPADPVAVAAVRVGPLRRSLELLLELPAPLEVRVALHHDRLEWTEYDPAAGWWSTTTVPAVPVRGHGDAAAVTVPRTLAREAVALESLAAGDAALCPVEIDPDVALHLDTFRVAASEAVAPIPAPPDPRALEPLHRSLPVPTFEGRDGAIARLDLADQAVEFTELALARFAARSIEEASLLRDRRHHYLIGTVPGAEGPSVTLVARGVESDPQR